MRKYMIAFLLILVCLIKTTLIYGENERDLIVFAGNLTGNWDIWTYNPNNLELKQLTNTTEDETNPIWLQAKSSIAYLRGGNIYLLKQGQEQQITTKGTYRYISYAAPKNQIIFSKFHAEEAEIGFINLSNRKEKIYFKRLHQQIHPRMGPDGKRIYFVEGYLVGNKVVQEIWVYEFKSRGCKLLFKEQGKPFFRPDSDPNGAGLVFVTSNQHSMELCLSNMENGQRYQELITTQAPFVDYPCWSSDGQKILYTTLFRNQQKLAVYDVKSRSVQVLAVDGECKEGKW